MLSCPQLLRIAEGRPRDGHAPLAVPGSVVPARRLETKAGRPFFPEVRCLARGVEDNCVPENSGLLLAVKGAMQRNVKPWRATA